MSLTDDDLAQLKDRILNDPTIGLPRNILMDLIVSYEAALRVVRAAEALCKSGVISEYPADFVELEKTLAPFRQEQERGK